MRENHCLCLWASLICRQSLSMHYLVCFGLARCGSLWFCLICLFAVCYFRVQYGLGSMNACVRARVSQRKGTCARVCEMEKHLTELPTCVWRHLQRPWWPCSRVSSLRNGSCRFMCNKYPLSVSLLFLFSFHKSGNCFKDTLWGICRVASRRFASSSNCSVCKNI